MNSALISFGEEEVIKPLSYYIDLAARDQFIWLVGAGIPIVNDFFLMPDIIIYPDKVNYIPKNTTHIMWIKN